MKMSIPLKMRFAGVIGSALAVAIVLTAIPWMSTEEPQAIDHPRLSETSESRVDWAFTQAWKLLFKGDLWVGYSVKRLMEEHSFIGTIHHTLTRRDEPSLESVVYGKRSMHPTSFRTRNCPRFSSELQRPPTTPKLEKLQFINPAIPIVLTP